MQKFFINFFRESEHDSRTIIDFLDSHPHIKEVCRTPLIATIVASLYENNFELPRSRTDVYKKRFDLLLQKWDAMRRVSKRTRISHEDKLKLISRLALRTHTQRTRTFKAKDIWRVWRSGFDTVYPDVTSESLLFELQHVDTVVVAEGDSELSLGHLSYQEYLAAHEIMLEQKVASLAREFGDPWWNQVNVFYAGLTGNVTRLFESAQKQARLIERDDLIDEMFAEARHTPEATRQIIADLRDDKLLRDLSHDGDAGTNIGEGTGEL